MGCCDRKREQFEIDVSAPGTYSIASALLFPRSPFGSVPVSGGWLTRASAADSATQGRTESTIIAAIRVLVRVGYDRGTKIRK
jgi:hypothetical protein